MLGILGPSFKAVSNSQVQLRDSKHVLLESDIRPLFAEAVTNLLYLYYNTLNLALLLCSTHS